jgi:Trypsin-like peptidase domain
MKAVPHATQISSPFAAVSDLRGERAMTDAVVQISTGGRGFLVGARERYVVTASHCLPRLPAPDPGAYLAQRTFEALLGPLGGACDVWAECVYADPVADLAVLAAPDAQHFASEARNYARLVGQRTPLRVAALPLARKGKSEAAEWQGAGRLFSLEGQWFECRLRATPRALWIGDKAQAFAGGMSGSPIADADGAALGVLCTTGANPILVQHLPRWLLDAIGGPVRYDAGA